MKNKKIEIDYSEYDHLDELSERDRRLLLAAREAGKNAYAPYSGFRVGAAVLLQNGEMILGNNQENAAYPSGCCAERIALFYASARYPGIAVTAIAISAFNNEPGKKFLTKSCGACCQVLSEYEDLAGLPLDIILDGNPFIRKIAGVDKLLPFRFNFTDLRSKRD